MTNSDYAALMLARAGIASTPNEYASRGSVVGEVFVNEDGIRVVIREDADGFTTDVNVDAVPLHVLLVQALRALDDRIASVAAFGPEACDWDSAGSCPGTLEGDINPFLLCDVHLRWHKDRVSRSQHEFVAPAQGEILYDAYGVWYWSPTGEPGVWSYPYGEDVDGVFTPNVDLRDSYRDGTAMYGNHAIV